MCRAILFQFLELFVCVKLCIQLCTESYLEGYIHILPLTPFPLENGLQDRLLGGSPIISLSLWYGANEHVFLH